MKLSLKIAAVLAALGGATLALAATYQPTPPPATALEPISIGEHARTIAAMKSSRRERPVVAVLGHNDGTETTDYLIPYAVLSRSGAAEVLALAPKPTPIRLRPALAVEPQGTLTGFDARYPDGADYVVVAAMHPRDDPEVLAWINAQAAKGAIIVGVCSGVRTLSAAGLLAGRSATRYWYDADDMDEANPTTRWVADRRYVVDRGVVTTTGITASLPVSLALVEAIAGRARAAEVAGELGVESWDASHDSHAFGFDVHTGSAAIFNKIAFWDHESLGIPVNTGVDEVALAFMADAWSRTFRSQAVTVAGRSGSITMRHGLKLVPDAIAGDAGIDGMLSPPPVFEAAKKLPATLHAIAQRYGANTASFVAVQLEYSWNAVSMAGIPAQSPEPAAP